jgi:ketosteroid isomerase-like protein
MKNTMVIYVIFCFVMYGCAGLKTGEENMKARNDAVAINNPALWPKPANPVAPGSETNENLKLVQQMFKAYAKGDVNTLRKIVAEDIEWYIPGRHPLSGTKKGVDEVIEFFKKLQIGGFKAEVMILAANDNYVIDAHRGWSTTGEKDIDLNWILLYKIEKGKIKRVQNFSGDLYTSDEFFNRVYGK